MLEPGFVRLLIMLAQHTITTRRVQLFLNLQEKELEDQFGCPPKNMLRLGAQPFMLFQFQRAGVW